MYRGLCTLVRQLDHYYEVPNLLSEVFNLTRTVSELFQAIVQLVRRLISV